MQRAVVACEVICAPLASNAERHTSVRFGSQGKSGEMVGSQTHPRTSVAGAELMDVIVTYAACGICLKDACLVRQEELGVRVRHLSAGGDRILRCEYDIRIRVGSPNVMVKGA